MTGPDDEPAPDPAPAPRPRWLRILRLEFFDTVVDAGFRWLLWAMIIGVGPGLALWPPLHRSDPKFVLDDVSRHLI
nr:hypothetical protein [Deltaproteobacteria bacterium]